MDLPIVRRSPYLQSVLLDVLAMQPALNHVDSVTARYADSPASVRREIIRVASAGKRSEWPSTLAKLKYDGRHHVPEDVATALVTAAKNSAGMHHGPAYRLGVQTTCEDISVLRQRVGEIDRTIKTLIDGSELASLLLTIDGIGPTTAARILAEFGDPAAYDSAAAFTAHFGVRS